jgi:hypothetical protein
MADLRTEISEIVTGLALLGFRDLDQVLAAQPAAVRNVTDDHFARLRAARDTGSHEALFATAWANGCAFARADEGLRGRPPWQVEWKGGHKPPGYEQIPADLRVDHVYLVSCKYGSNILHNVSPAHLFERRLAARRGERVVDWFAVVAPEAYQELYNSCRREFGFTALPDRVDALAADHRSVLKALPSRWPASLLEPYRDFAQAVSLGSAARWLASLTGKAQREEMVWRMLRLQAAPYFVLGATTDGRPLRYRVGTPWDFRSRYEFGSFDAWPDVAGQPRVRWRAEVRDRQTGDRCSIDGHVEIRWSHGRFSGHPEAKVRLDTHPHDTAGYVPLGS